MKLSVQFTRFSIAFKWVCVGVCLWLGVSTFSIAESAWQAIAPGIDYQSLPYMLTPWSRIHVFRIQLAIHPLAMARAKDMNRDQAFVSELAHHANALLAINGGFFDLTFRPLGLRIDHGQQYSALKPISWWGVFYIHKGRAFIKRVKEITPTTLMHFAIQSGPRLLVAGQIPSLKPGRDERTALGITREGTVLIVVTENVPLTTTELAEIMKAPPIMAWDALNLDGGSSTQLYANFPTLKRDVHGLAMVADAVVVE